MATSRVSTSMDGSQENDFSQTAQFVTNDSVVFGSAASNLVLDDTNAASDIFRKILSTGEVTRLSTTATGGQINDSSFLTTLQGTNLVFFTTAALDPGDTNTRADVYLKDLTSGSIRLVSSNADGTSLAGANGSMAGNGSVLSPDCMRVVFTNNVSFRASDIFVKDLADNSVTRVSADRNGVAANNVSGQGVFSPDGTKVLFNSLASNLVAGDTNATYDIFLKDLVDGTVTRISTAEGGTQGSGQSFNAVFSPDGTKVAFRSEASDLVSDDTNGQADIFIKTLATGEVLRVSARIDGTQGDGFSDSPVFSPDGRSLVFTSLSTNLVAGDTNGAQDVFRRDLVTGEITRVSVATDGSQGDGFSANPSISPDGSRIAFETGAAFVADDTNDNVDVYVTDIVCFAGGTRIATASGPTPVERLAVGDRVVTASGAHRPIRWLGHRAVDCRRHPRPHEVMPVRIAAHAFGEGRPTRDLRLSPGHAICVDLLGEVLIPAGALVNGATIVQEEVEQVTYWHVELDAHDILLAEDLPCESYCAMGNRGFFAESGVVAMDASPDAPAATHADFCRPFHADGALVAFVRERLARRAGSSGWRLEPTSLADLHLLVDGCRVEADTRGLRARFRLPANARQVWLVGGTSVPADIGHGPDRRALGVCIASLTFDDGFDAPRVVGADDRRLCVGFHDVEAGPQRWTAGRAKLPPALWEGLDGAISLRVDLALPLLPRWSWGSEGLSAASTREAARSAAKLRSVR